MILIKRLPIFSEHKMKTYYSHTDKSVNFVQDNLQESRFVQRTNDYFIVYLSSQDGCNKACRFCHLTQTGQTQFTDSSLKDYIEQAIHPIMHYKKLIENGQAPAKKVNFNFMARGEPFANHTVLNNAHHLIEKLKETVTSFKIETKFNFSTIGPLELKNKEFTEIFKDNIKDVVIYYSLYSVEDSFRKRWIPKSLPVDEMMEKLKNWENAGGKVAFHWAFIEGENDSKEDIEKIMEKISQFELSPKFNLVRYNPYSQNQGKESKEEILEENFKLFSEFLKNPQSRIVPRVGFDVKASCGMFMTPEQ